jgi:GT2 family glycosyltransferase
MHTPPRIHVLAPVHNRRAVTEKFVRCLLAQTYTQWHLVLIDDGSTDGTENMVRGMVPPGALTVLRGRGNWWWAGSLHQGYLWLKRHGAAAGDLVLIMNDDTEFDADFLARAVHAMKPASLMLAQAHHVKGGLDEVGVSWDWKRLQAVGVTDMADVSCFSTRGLFLHVADFLRLGGFRPLLLPHYLSDYEFSMRAHRKGLAFITSPDVFLRFDDSQALTGIRSTEGYSALKSLRMNLSTRSTDNPFHWTSFILLTCPARYIPLNLIRVWWRFFAPLRKDIRRLLWRSA